MMQQPSEFVDDLANMSTSTATKSKPRSKIDGPKDMIKLRNEKNGEVYKFACSTCIGGHRAPSCDPRKHKDVVYHRRPTPGRPTRQCGHVKGADCDCRAGRKLCCVLTAHERERVIQGEIVTVRMFESEEELHQHRAAQAQTRTPSTPGFDQQLHAAPQAAQPGNNQWMQAVGFHPVNQSQAAHASIHGIPQPQDSVNLDSYSPNQGPPSGVGTSGSVGGLFHPQFGTTTSHSTVASKPDPFAQYGTPSETGPLPYHSPTSEFLQTSSHPYQSLNTISESSTSAFGFSSPIGQGPHSEPISTFSNTTPQYSYLPGYQTTNSFSPPQQQHQILPIRQTPVKQEQPTQSCCSHKSRAQPTLQSALPAFSHEPFQSFGFPTAAPMQQFSCGSCGSGLCTCGSCPPTMQTFANGGAWDQACGREGHLDLSGFAASENQGAGGMPTYWPPGWSMDGGFDQYMSGDP